MHMSCFYYTFARQVATKAAVTTISQCSEPDLNQPSIHLVRLQNATCISIAISGGRFVGVVGKLAR